MNVSQKKTKVTASTDGFDFLGWRFYVQKNNEKFRSIPSTDNFKSFHSKVKNIVNNSNYGAETKVSKLAPIIRGWRYYHKYCKMDGSRFNLFGLEDRTRKVFLKQKTIGRHQAVKMVRTAFPKVSFSENKFVSVKGDKSPFDGDLVYWSKRNSILYDGILATTLRKQNHHGGRVTYLATDLQQEQKVVIKQFQFAQGSASWSIQDILEREIKILRQLNHQRIPRYIDSFSSDDGFCLVQEYKAAPSLAEVQTFSPEQIKAITISVLEILVDLQRQIPPVIHRDIKPANILVDRENNAYLIDFGFSRIGGEEVSGSSVVKGTPGFMPPEQLWGRLTLSSDLYSLGMTVICLLCGIDSFSIRQHINNDYQINFRPLVSGVSNHFLEWLEKMVQPNPSNRYQDSVAALEALQIINIIPSASEQKQARLKDRQSNLGQKIFHWLTLKSTVISLTIGIIVGSAWGKIHQLHSLGFSIGIFFGLGLSLVIGFPRKSKEFLSLPSWQNIIGAAIMAVSIGLIINPAILLYSSQYFGFASWKHHHQQVAQGTGFILYTDVPDKVEDSRYTIFLNQFRQEVAEHLFDPGKASCTADVHLLKKDKNYFAVANRFGFKTPYGFFMRSPWHHPIMIVRRDSGLGTLTHQMMYHYLACSYPEGLPLWARQGAATFVEKFLAIENNNRLNFSWIYRSNWRDPHVRKILDTVNLADTLQTGKQQSVIRSFFLFLHHEKLLFPLLDRLHGERGNGIDRIEQLFDEPITEVETLWKQWLLSDALQLPMVESSFMVWGKNAHRVQKFLNYYWLWNQEKKMWIKSPKLDRDYMIPAKERIFKALK